MLLKKANTFQQLCVDKIMVKIPYLLTLGTFPQFQPPLLLLLHKIDKFIYKKEIKRKISQN